MKRQPLELVRLGQGSVLHVCLPPDPILRSLHDHKVLIGDTLYLDPDLKFLSEQHRALCGRYGVPNMDPVRVGHRTYDPAHMRVCALCAYSLAEVRHVSDNAFDLAMRRAVRVLRVRLDLREGKTR